MLVAPRLILPQTRKPMIVDFSLYSGTVTPMVIPLPLRREAGLLAVVFAADNSGAGVPALASGWNNINAAGRRAAYRRLDGSEDPTISMVSTGSTQNTAIIATIAGSAPNKVPENLGGATATSTTPNSLSASVAAPPGSGVLFLAGLTHGNADVLEFPADYDILRKFVRNAAGGVAMCAKNTSLRTDDAPAWLLSASVFWTASIVGIRGF